jgi:hypothetical protein
MTSDNNTVDTTIKTDINVPEHTPPKSIKPIMIRKLGEIMSTCDLAKINFMHILSAAAAFYTVDTGKQITQCGV